MLTLGNTNSHDPAILELIKFSTVSVTVTALLFELHCFVTLEKTKQIINCMI